MAGLSDIPIAVSIVAPHNYPHVGAYLPIAETVFQGFRKLGMPCKWMENQVDSSRLTILFGAHLLDDMYASMIPRTTIIYNLEQYDPNNPSPWFRNEAYKRLIHTHPVWDYSYQNVQTIRCSPFKPPLIQHVPIGVAREFPPPKIGNFDDKKFDVIFYGSLNSRRMELLRRMGDLGLAVKVLSGVYGNERDAWVAQSKFVLNIHFYEASIFEWPRVLPLLWQGVPVVSEVSGMQDLDEALPKVVKFAPYDQLPNVCKELANNPSELARMAVEGQRYAVRRDEAEFLRRSLLEFVRLFPGGC